MSGANWQISAGDFTEALRPASYLLATLASTWTLARAQRRGINTPAAVAVALMVFTTTFFLPLVLLPLVAAWVLLRPDALLSKPPQAEVAEPEPSSDEEKISVADDAAGSDERSGRTRRHLATLLLYALLLLIPGALFFYRDYQTVDAHLTRAQRAELRGRTGLAINEYEAALRLEDDAHTHKLLGLQLVRAGRTEEALTQFLAAERGGELDEKLSLRLATTYDTLHRPFEAAAAYRRVLNNSQCAAPLPAPECTTARQRLVELDGAESP